jgi:hypothetical protein
MKISEYQEVKEDIIKFQTAIDAIPNQNLKEKSQKDLNQLKAAYQRIDNGHDTSFNGRIKPSSLKDTIFETVELRRRLEKVVEDVKSL